ncbi:betaine--homocysteine S-methyltransferase [Inquilinus sp. CAU 1745]|uniref:betaine--homocysteine S-methyltransferase n=1 Tax=Inquilinus sp. CAU 1745 TaxID=3140369 RepID=UPI00325AB211
MTDPIRDLLSRKPVLFADGAMGTSLFALGLETGDNPELWNVDHPDRVAEVHRGFVEAGSDIVLTNSFGGNARRLMLHQLQGRVGELNRAAAEVARNVADQAGHKVLVAGSMGPTGDIMAPVGALSTAEAEEAFAAQAEALKEGGVDLLWIETISAMDELTAAVAGAARTGLPIVATLTFDTHGRTMMGVTTAEAAKLAAGLPVPPVAIGANCGIGPSQLLESVLGLVAAAGPEAVVVAKGNAGIPQYRAGHIHYDGSPDVMADYAALARDAGARIIGGCCGNTAAHIRAMVEAVGTRPRRDPPSLEAVAAALGPLNAPAKTDGEERRERKRRRG